MRLIDADALSRKWQDVLNEKADEKGTVAYITFELFIERLKEEPTIDAVPVVCCKDCANLKFSWCSKWNNIMRDNGFCSYGERKEDVAVATDDEEPEEDYCAACEITYSWEKDNAD